MALQVRGRVLTGLMAGFDKLPGGREQGLATLPPAIRDRIEPIWIATAWYDAEIVFALYEALATLAGAQTAALVRRGSERAAEADIRGIYRQQLRPASPADMGERLPRIFHRYFEAPLNMRAATPDSLECEMCGIPARRAVLFQAMQEGFMGAALRIAGAHDPRFAWTQRAGTISDEVDCVLRLTWGYSR